MASDMKYLMEKATSPLLLEMDWDTTMQIVDKIRQGDIPAKTAVSSVLNHLEDKNHNIVLATLSIAEALMKNCGSMVHEVMATKDSMAVFYNLMHRTDNDEVKSRTIMLLSAWTFAFRNKASFGAIQDCLSLLKMEGCEVPAVAESDAMFMAEMAPDWVDGEKCYRCRTQFSLLRRKHHCRACGQVFCSDCSSKTSTIPKFGIEREVRVCFDCYTEINSPSSKARPSNVVSSSEAARSNQKAEKEKEEKEKQKAQELREEEELQLALALSKSEHETKEKEKMRSSSNRSAPASRRATSPTPPTKKYEEEQDPELAKYLNRTYWEEQKEKTNDPMSEKSGYFASSSPSAPQGATKNRYKSAKATESYLTSDPDDLDDFVATLRSQLEIFVNRMKSNQSRGRPIANDSAVQSLFMSITTMHAQLLKHIQEIDTKRVYYEQLQDKISQTRDARAALEALREEHREKLRQEREEQDRIRQIQMMQKLEIMRKKKQEYLEYQRQMALHRMAESERQILNQPGTMPTSQMPPGHGYPMHYPGAYPGQQPMGYMPPEAMQMPPGGMPNYQAQPQGMAQNGYPNATASQPNMPTSQPAPSSTVPQPSMPHSQIPGPVPPATQPEYGYPMPGPNPGMPPTTYMNTMQPPMSQVDPGTVPSQPQMAPPPVKQEEAALISFD